MSGLTSVLFMSLLLGTGCFFFGMLPLSFTFSKSQLAKLSSLGTGLLLGTALGVIIPEGIETLASARSSSELPTTQIAFSLLSGFTFMLIVEKFLSPHSHSDLPQHFSLPPIQDDAQSYDLEFDAGVEESDLERSSRKIPGFKQIDMLSPISPDMVVERTRAFPLTLGLIIHGLADGLALGVSGLSQSTPNAHSDLSVVVFLALIIHKAPTALALTTSLLSSSLSRAECRRHLALFSASTPFGALVSYGLFSFLEAEGADWTGIALLLSGGTFLYVATVMQPVSTHSQAVTSENLDEAIRSAFVVFGIFLPIVISVFIGHGHSRDVDLPNSST